MNIFERFRFWLGVKLLLSKGVTATATMLSSKVNKTRCIHCGKNPFFID